MTMPSDTVAVLGAGSSMGFSIARSIALADIPVRAWDQARGRAEPLSGHGAQVAGTAAEAAEGAGIVLTMIEDPDDLLGLMETDVLPVMRAEDGPQHAIWLQMAEIGEEATARCVRLANSHGVGFVDAPVIGTKRHADQGRLVVVESGPEEARPRVQPVFDAIGYRTVRAGEAGTASRLKPGQ